MGAILIITGSIGMAYFYIEKEKQKMAFIEMWDNVLSMYINEIAFKKQSLAFASYEIGQRIGGKEGDCFRRIYARMIQHNRESFSNIWMDEWKNYLKDKRSSHKERILIEEFINISRLEDEEILVRMMEEQQKKWRNLCTEVGKEQQERKKMIWTLSICFSLMLILILI